MKSLKNCKLKETYGGREAKQRGHDLQRGLAVWCIPKGSTLKSNQKETFFATSSKRPASEVSKVISVGKQWNSTDEKNILLTLKKYILIWSVAVLQETYGMKFIKHTCVRLL